MTVQPEFLFAKEARIQKLQKENEILRDMLRAEGWSNNEIQAAVDVLKEARDG